MTSQPAGGTQPAAPDTAAPANQALAHPAPVHHVVRWKRIGGTWVAAALFAVVLRQLLIFHPGNSQSVSIERKCPSITRRHRLRTRLPCCIGEDVSCEAAPLARLPAHHGR